MHNPTLGKSLFFRCPSSDFAITQYPPLPPYKSGGALQLQQPERQYPPPPRRAHKKLIIASKGEQHRRANFPTSSSRTTYVHRLLPRQYITWILTRFLRSPYGHLRVQSAAAILLLLLLLLQTLRLSNDGPGPKKKGSPSYAT